MRKIVEENPGEHSIIKKIIWHLNTYVRSCIWIQLKVHGDASFFMPWWNSMYSYESKHQKMHERNVTIATNYMLISNYWVVTSFDKELLSGWDVGKTNWRVVHMVASSMYRVFRYFNIVEYNFNLYIADVLIANLRHNCFTTVRSRLFFLYINFICLLTFTFYLNNIYFISSINSRWPL